MYMEIEAMVKREQCKDLQREAEWERLIRQVYAGHQPRRVGAQMWIKHIVAAIQQMLVQSDVALSQQV